MVNLNIEVPDALHKRAKLAAMLDEKTLKEYLVKILRERVSQDAAANGFTRTEARR